LGKGELGELIDQGEGFQGQRHRLGGRGLGATQNRQIRVPNFWVAIDQGIAVQPDNIIAQTESSVVCGLGLSPKERISIKNGEARIELLRLHGYAQSRRSRDSCRGRRYDNHPTGVGLFGCTLRITGVPTGRDAPTKTHRRARCGLAFNGSKRVLLRPVNRPQAARSLRRYLRARSLAACSARATPNRCVVRGSILDVAGVNSALDSPRNQPIVTGTRRWL
jgi:hypothetical protein